MTQRLLDVIVGLQWGDEGKGRVVDSYAAGYDVIARFGGGNNAGHSIKVGDRALALRSVPSGVLVEHTELFIGGGTVVSLRGLLDEMDGLAKVGVDVSRIKISDRAHVVLPHHPLLDQLHERARGAAAVGTTGRGIGPAYVDKAGRLGLTFGDLAHRERLVERIRLNLASRATTFAGVPDAPREAETVAEVVELAQRLASHVVDGVDYLHTALERGKRILAEGAQGTLLDVGYGTYPFVTSSSTIAGAACTGLGVGPTAVGRVIGIAKAYCTRVGAGPFPSELSDATGEELRAKGAEFGVVTGRPRRCGWFDAVAGRYAVRLNGATSVYMTKLDVLSGFPRIGVVVAYRSKGEQVDFAAANDEGLETELAWFEGWTEDISGVRRIADLPRAAREYVNALQDFLGIPVERVSVGAERSAFAE